MKRIKAHIERLKLKYAVRWISAVPGLKIVRIERRGKTDYLISAEGQFWRLNK